jgi:hypothetical protein
LVGDEKGVITPLISRNGLAARACGDDGRMSEPYPEDLLAAVDLYVDVQQVLLNRLVAGADPARVVVAIRAQLEQLQTAARDHRVPCHLAHP